METEKVNPLFQIAIQGDKEKARAIAKFFAIHGALNIHNFTYNSENNYYYATKPSDSILVGSIPIECAGNSRKIVTLFEAEKIMQKWEESLRQPNQKRRKHKIHKSNCVNKVRFTVTDQLGNTITVCGKYAYEWTINVDKDGMVIQTSFKGRKEALTELERLTGKKII